MIVSPISAVTFDGVNTNPFVPPTMICWFAADTNPAKEAAAARTASEACIVMIGYEDVG